jgi:hypothetical protein
VAVHTDPSLKHAPRSRRNQAGRAYPTLKPEKQDSIRVTIHPMQIAVFAMRTVEVFFFCGLAGSAVVVLISFVEDAKELFGED